MNTPAPDFRARKQATLIAMVGASVALGIADVAIGVQTADPQIRLGFTLIGNVVLLLIGFHWLRLDAAELDIRRPTWLNIGIAALAAVFVPYYLYKTRPEGRRAQAIFGFIGLVVACMFASALGAMLMAGLSGTAPGTV